ncbi:MAG: hypothetical protein AB8B55_18280 [Mariniblastus sp.]
MRILLCIITCILFSTGNLNAQEDPIRLLRMFPPEYLGEKQLAEGLSALEWQLNQKIRLAETYRTNAEEFKAVIKGLNEKANSLTEKLPPAIRLLSAQDRSRLVGKIMEEQLNGRLELATREHSVAILAEDGGSKPKMTPEDELNKLEMEAKYHAQVAKLDTAKHVYQNTAKLAEKAFKTQNEKRMAQYTVEVAELELAGLKKRLDFLKQQPQAKLSDSIADARLEMEPIKASLKAAEEQLEKFTSSAELIESIEQSKQAITLWQKDLRFILEKLMALESEANELQVLKSQIQKQVKHMKAKKQSSGKSTSDND